MLQKGRLLHTKAAPWKDSIYFRSFKPSSSTQTQCPLHCYPRKPASSHKEPLFWQLLATGGQPSEQDSLTFRALALQQSPYAPPPYPHWHFPSIRPGKRRREAEGTAERRRPVAIHHFFLMEREGQNCFFFLTH